MEELCFELTSFDRTIINEKLISQKLINFALQHNISIGGNLDLGFCFCSDDNKIPLDLEFKFIDFIKTEYSDIFGEIIFKEYKEYSDSLEEFKRVSLRK